MAEDGEYHVPEGTLTRAFAERAYDTHEYFQGSRYEMEHEPELDFESLALHAEEEEE